MNITPVMQCGFCEKTRSDESSTGQLLVCGRCKIVKYCSKNCQKQHWPTHKASCLSATIDKIEEASILLTTPLRQNPLTLDVSIAEHKATEDLIKATAHLGLRGRERELTALLYKDKIDVLEQSLKNEEDFELVIRWIKDQLKTTVHPVLCYQLSLALRKKLLALPFEELTSALLIEALGYKILGETFFSADFNCVNFSNLYEALAERNNFTDKYILTRDECIKIRDFQATHPHLERDLMAFAKEKVIEIRSNLRLLRSPSWLSSLSLFHFTDRSRAMKPKNEWDSIRLNDINHLYDNYLNNASRKPYIESSIQFVLGAPEPSVR